MSALPSVLVPEPARVLAAEQETQDTLTLTLESPRGARFLPGQFNMLYAFGVGEAAISMSGDPARADAVTHTIRGVGAVTQALCRTPAGAVVGVRGPFGTPWPLDAARGSDVLIIAGGLGLAPLRPAIYHLLAERADYGRIWLLAGARTPADLLFRKELERWAADGAMSVEVTVDLATTDWRGRVGVVPALLGGVELDPARAVAFVCGPEVMMRFSVRELERRGLSGERMYLAMERNMKCAVGFCGHCQYRESFICKDGSVLRYDRIRSLLWAREV